MNIIIYVVASQLHTTIIIGKENREGNPWRVYYDVGKTKERQHNHAPVA